MSKESLKGFRKIADFTTYKKAKEAEKALKNRAFSGIITKIQKRTEKHAKIVTTKNITRIQRGRTGTAIYYRLWAK